LGYVEKIAPTLLAGVPCIVKPATDGAQLTQAVVKAIEETVLPKGALQLICGQTYDLFEQLRPTRLRYIYRFSRYRPKIT
jgi:oxepin-CoA hydrolase/3-oxo-5,6-dehydrosuberyl-CoA semialdehyde dehydrogenase